MKRIPFYPEPFILVLWLCSFAALKSPLQAQGLTSCVGERENIGIYGGPAIDLSWAYTGNRLFAAVQSPGTLFHSDDNGTNWVSSFPFDSLEFDFGMRGWGGGSVRVLTNNAGWVAVHTEGLIPNLSSAVISYDNGYSFKTAADYKITSWLTGQSKSVTSIALTDHYFYIGCENYMLRVNDTIPFGSEMIEFNLADFPGIDPQSDIVWVSASNDSSGYPLYFITENPEGLKNIYKWYPSVLMELFLPATGTQALTVFTHPAQITGDSLLISIRDTVSQNVLVYKSFNGGFAWTNVSPPGGSDTPMKDADYSPDWVAQMPASNGMRVSFPGGPVSDDYGSTWQGPASGLMSFGIATHPELINIITGSNHVGVTLSNTGINGTFTKTDNIGFASASAQDIQAGTGVFYVATEAGLAFTSEYYNPNISGYQLWINPNGMFPVPNAGNQQGVSSVAIDPFNPNHVICGSSQGFYTTFNGPTDFFNVFPTNWNSNGHLDPFVTDIVFVNSTIVLAVTGYKHRWVNMLPFQPVGNIWRSADGGQTWTVVTPLLPDEFTMGNCLTVVMNGSQPEVYAGSGYRKTPSMWVPGALWKSVDLGLTWQKVNDGPALGIGLPQPIFDIDFDPANSQLLYLSADEVFARSNTGGYNYFFTDVPNNTGPFTSALIVPSDPDSIYITAGRNLYKYSFTLDDADLKFKGLPGESFITSSFGSVLAGSEMGVSGVTEAPTYDLELKTYIEGAFNGTDMNTGLNSLGYLPLEQPFNQAPWYYSGSETVAAIPNPDIVDWILVEIRITDGDSSTATTETRFEQKAGFLLKNGEIVDDDGITPLRFSVILATTKGSDKVHGVVYCPGHSGERTSTEMTQAKNNIFSYDFTSGPDQVYGGASAHKELAPGIWGMIAGDGDSDGVIDNKDKNDVWLPELGLSGYMFSDFNRDGQVNPDDKSDFWIPNTGTGNKIE